MLFKKKPVDPERGTSEVKRCSFCHKAEAEVTKLIAGPSVYICDECVRVCTLVLAEDPVIAPPADEGAGASPDLARTAYCAFCGRPIEWSEAVLGPGQGAYCPACVADDAKPKA